MDQAGVPVITFIGKTQRWGGGPKRATTVMFLDDPEQSEDDSIGCAA